MRTSLRGREEAEPSPEEIRALMERLAGSNRAREEGASTIHDFAEAFGTSSEAVQLHLERIRAEAALRRTHRTQRSQLPLLGLAVVLFGVAFAVYKSTPPRPLTPEELEAKLKVMQAARAKKPKAIRYPILSEVKDAEARPPRNFDISIRGVHTTTTYGADPKAPFESRERLIQKLTAALQRAVPEAIRNEQSAPIPSKPLKIEPWGLNPTPEQMVCLLGTAMGQSGTFLISLKELSNTPEGEREKRVREWMAIEAARMVDSAIASQAQSLRPVDRGAYNNYIPPPPGFSMNFQGRRQRGWQPQPLIVLPIAADAMAHRFELCVREMMRLDASPMREGIPEFDARDAKAVAPEFATCTITGPNGSRSFKIPCAPSAKFRSAAEVARAADAVVRKETVAFRTEIETMNRQVTRAK